MSGAPGAHGGEGLRLGARQPCQRLAVVTDLDTGSVLGGEALELEGFVLESLLPEQLQLGIDALRPDDFTPLSSQLELGQVFTREEPDQV